MSTKFYSLSSSAPESRNDISKKRCFLLFSQSLSSVRVKIPFNVDIFKHLPKLSVMIFEKILPHSLLLDLKVLHEDYSVHVERRFN